LEQEHRIHRERTLFSALLFALVCVAMFLAVVLLVPVRFRTPEPLRLRYCSLQAGVRYGPLSSSWGDYEWRKTFDWQAGDTEYRPRPVSQFFETLTPRIHVHLWHFFGPFLWYPLDLILTIAIGLFIALIVLTLTGSWGAGLVGGVFWLVTIEALVGFFFPVRPTKSLVTLEFLLGITALLRLRGHSPLSRPGWAATFGVAALLGLFTDEYGYLAVAVYLFFLIFSPSLRRSRLWLGGLSLLLLTAAVTVILYWLPLLGYNRDLPPFAISKTRETVAGLVSRNLDYGLKNSWHAIKCFSGWPGAFETWAKIALAASLAGLAWLFVRTRAWKGLLWPGLILLVLGLQASFVLLPAGTDILYQYTYYNRPLTALLCVLLGCATANVFESGRRRFSFWLVLLLLPVLFAARYSWFEATGVEENDLGPYGVDKVLSLETKLRGGGLKAPVYLAYPRASEISRGAWDELRFRGWWTRGEAPSWLLCRYLTPLLYLRRFEAGELLGDPREFKAWCSVPEEEYLDRASTYFDLLQDSSLDLAALRAAEPPPVAWEGPVAARTPGFWGFPEKVVLAAGRHRAVVPAGPEAGGEATLIMVLRGHGRFRVLSGDKVVLPWSPLDYDNAFKLMQVPIAWPSPNREVILQTDSPGNIEVLGPALMSDAAVRRR